MSLKNKPEGFLNIDKPSGPSSFDIIRRIRLQFRGVKAGHGGTLDPLASGVLVIALGSMTRMIPYLELSPKRYRFKIQFGTETDTLDSSGKILKRDTGIPERGSLEKILGSFRGRITQTPPLYSAVKINGVPAYKLARAGRDFSLPEKSVDITELDLIEYSPEKGEALITVECSPGTYIRSLARDISRALGTEGYASMIQRRGCGDYSIEESFSMSDDPEETLSMLKRPADVIRDSLVVKLDQQMLKRVSNGMEVHAPVSADKSILFGFDSGNELSAVLENRGSEGLHPVKVFRSGRE
ncbi:MAG: tRNA pseudouridine(55) synthase TruB [Chitinivibrionales bacterium]